MGQVEAWPDGPQEGLVGLSFTGVQDLDVGSRVTATATACPEKPYQHEQKRALHHSGELTVGRSGFTPRGWRRGTPERAASARRACRASSIARSSAIWAAASWGAALPACAACRYGARPVFASERQALAEHGPRLGHRLAAEATVAHRYALPLSGLIAPENRARSSTPEVADLAHLALRNLAAGDSEREYLRGPDLDAVVGDTAARGLLGGHQDQQVFPLNVGRYTGSDAALIPIRALPQFSWSCRVRPAQAGAGSWPAARWAGLARGRR
jgi:hypothetical protein